MKNSLREQGKRILNMLKPRRRPGLLSFIALTSLALVLLFVIAPQAHASIWGDVADGMLSFLQTIMMGLTSVFLSMAVFFMRFVIEIASYNNYINSSAVILGWVLVRDVTNMFFVIILMVIAFGTVLGIEQYEWKKMLVKFVFAAIFVNFSRVICGVIIDASQVFMMTFISGVAATGGGNLINALGLDKMLSISKSASAEAMGAPLNFAMAAIAACIFSFTAMVVIGAFVVMLLARVIALWVLIILSPLAFVFGLIPRFQSHSSEWWTQFINNAISGPVLAFFLWLTFAIAGGADVHSEFTANSAYPIGDNATAQAAAADLAGGESSNSLNEMMEPNNLAGFIIAIALLMAGIKVTQKLAGAGAAALGVAAGAAKGFAMVATGAAAARWGVGAAKAVPGKAWAGAKKVGGFVEKRIPFIGGNARERYGAKIVNVGKRFDQWRDAAVAKGAEKRTREWGEKAGEWGKGEKGLAGRGKRVIGWVGKKASVGAGELLGDAVGSGKRRKNILEKITGIGASIDAQTIDLMGTGMRTEGQKLTEQKVEEKRVHADAEIAKREGVGKVEAENLRKIGQPEKADAVLAAIHVANVKEKKAVFESMNQAELKTSAVNLKSERDNLEKQQEKIDEMKSGRKRNKAQNELDGKKDEITVRAAALLTVATDRGASAHNDVVGALTQGKFNPVERPNDIAKMMTAITGINANRYKSQADESFKRAAGDRHFASMRALRDALLATKDASKAAAIGSGNELKKVGTRTVKEKDGKVREEDITRLVPVMGWGSGVGTHDADGNMRKPFERDLLAHDKKTLEYHQANTADFKHATDAEALLTRNGAGQVVGWTEANMTAFFDRLSNVTTALQATTVGSLAQVNQLNSADSGISGDMANTYLRKMIVLLKDKKPDVLAGVLKQMSGMREKVTDTKLKADIEVFIRAGESSGKGSKKNAPPPVDDSEAEEALAEYEEEIGGVKKS